MKKILLAAALAGTALGGFSAAQAADLPAKAKYYKAPAVAVYNWTGFYIGVNAGVGFGRSYTHISSGGADPREFVGGLGGFGGGQIGYNWQYGNLLGFGNMVLGLEADLQGGSLRDNRTTVNTGLAAGGGFGLDQKTDWFGTVRGRVGIAQGSVLSYFTGGFAYGGVKTGITDLTNATTTNISGTRTGWTIGSGVEAALGGNWTGKIEYLYVDLGSQSATVLAPRAYLYTSEIREHLFRVGLNYRIGGPSAWSEPVANVGGWYVGGNFGGATALNRSDLISPGVANERFNLSPNGYAGGLQAGYNWQAANWVLGLEADIQGSSQRDNKTVEFTGAPGVFAAYNQKMQWFGTVRGRVGYMVGSTLFYGTGGFAYGGVKTDIATTFGAPLNQSFSRTKTGYAVGGGIESPFNAFGWFGPNWTSKTEYLYVDLGRSTDPILGSTFTFSTRATEHVFRTGLNYHFNSPVVAKY
jgi:outer membrane immunogenic protein